MSNPLAKNQADFKIYFFLVLRLFFLLPLVENIFSPLGLSLDEPVGPTQLHNEYSGALIFANVKRAAIFIKGLCDKNSF